MARKEPNPIDVHVGGRVRLRRLLVGMSQEKLGEKLGLTFQQIQKYEKGTNRIGASRLFEMARVLEVPVQFFYQDMEPAAGGEPAFAESEGAPFVMDFVSSAEGLALNRAFAEIADPDIRRAVVDLVKQLAKGARKGAGGPA